MSETCCHKTKERSEKELKDLLNRLSRIEGQIRGIRGMVERDAYCTDILTQVAAASAALSGFTKVLLANHIKTCVAQDIRDGKDETIDELLGHCCFSNSENPIPAYRHFRFQVHKPCN